jgi:cysteine desulfurase
MPVRPEAHQVMNAAEAFWANPGAIHKEAVAAKESLEKARAAIALELAVKPREIVFTSGLTESDNLAILGTARAREIRGEDLRETHWVTSSIEHDAVLECFAEIERRGGRVSHIDPDERGLISPEAVLRVVRKETVLVSIGWANSEIGVVQPLREISQAIRRAAPHILIHSDSGQAPLYLSPQAHSLGVDLLSLGSNKIGGPHGIGALCVSNRAAISGVVRGGRQERGLRAGTENVALAAGFAAALQSASRERHEAGTVVRGLRDALLSSIIQHIPGLVVNGSPKYTLPHMLNVSIPGISSEYVTLALDAAGIAISTKSACREGESPESHVVKALGGEEWRARHTLRFSLAAGVSVTDIERVAQALSRIVDDPASKER